MRRKDLAGILVDLRREQPQKCVSLVRLVWPEIKAALDRGHSIKVIHERFVERGVSISYRLFALYVSQLRREHTQRGTSAEDPAAYVSARRQAGASPNLSSNDENLLAIIRVPKRRLFSAKAAAQYLGIHEETLRKLTETGVLPVSRLGTRRVYKLEDLNSYIESLPSCVGK